MVQIYFGATVVQYLLNTFYCVFTCKMTYSALRGNNQAEFGHNEEMCCSEFATYFVYSPDNVTCTN